MQASNHSELYTLLNQIQDGLPHEKQSALKQLAERVKGSKDPEVWNIMGMAYLLSGRPDDAVSIFNKLVSAFPEEDTYRLNLGTAYSQAEQIEMAQYHFGQLADHGMTEEGRLSGQQSLAALEHHLGTSQLDREFRQYQVSALNERLSDQNTIPEDYRRLARLLLRMEREANAPATLSEITALLEKGQEKHPGALAILELLAYCYTRQGINDRLMNVVKQIEKIAPDSPILQALEDNDDGDLETFHQNRLQRAYDLMNQSQSQDPKLSQVALDELRKMIAMAPTNFDYRTAYAFALSGIGKKKEAIEQAEILAKAAGEEHNQHFNIGQIFWLSGDLKRGKAHLELAYQYAANEEERRDVLQRITDLETSSR